MFAGRAARVRDIGVVTALYGSSLFIALTLLASLATAAVYGVGGSLVINGTFQIGTLVALTLLIGRLYGPITALSNVQVDVMTALVSFDRVFEVLDLRPLIEDRPDARTLRLAGQAGSAPGDPAAGIEFDHVSFRYPTALGGLAGLPGVHRAARARAGRRRPGRAARRRASAPRPASSPRWSARRARARPRSPPWSPGSMTRLAGASASAAPTCAR